MALKAFHDLAAPNKALSLISYLNACSSAALDSLRFLICHILSCPMFLLVTLPSVWIVLLHPDLHSLIRSLPLIL